MRPNGPLKVAHVITGLQTGGAETLLLRILERIDRSRIDASVISLTSEGPLGPRIEALGVPVRALGLRKVPTPWDVVRLGRAVRDASPDLVQTWLPHANVLGGCAARLSGRAPVVWGVHVTVVDRAGFGARAAGVQRAEKTLSHAVPARIVACSQSALDFMKRRRYAGDKLELIPNGFDVERFRPSPDSRREARTELGLAEDSLVVGHVARFHPIKDHRTMLAAAAEVAERVPDVHFVLCGAGVTRSNAEFAALAAPLGDRVHALGERDDIARLNCAMDVAVSSSAGEALPLAVGEAMACGLPVAATNCGDSPVLVGDTGRIAPVGDPAALAEAIASLLELPVSERQRMGDAARRRIAERYEIGRMTERYEATWRELSPERGAVPGGG